MSLIYLFALLFGLQLCLLLLGVAAGSKAGAVFGAFGLVLVSAGLWLLRSQQLAIKSLSKALARGESSSLLSLNQGAGDGRGIASLTSALAHFMKNSQEQLSRTQRFHLHYTNIIESLQEGVLLISREDGRVRFLNRTAALLLGVEIGASIGRPVDEIVSAEGVVRLIRDIREGGSVVEGELQLEDESRSILKVYGGMLPPTEGEPKELFVVIHDLTEIRRLERVRREFIANVSHELKTPITSIKGSVETLLDGALDSPEDAERFTAMIGRQAERLHLIFEDMLALSRLEQDRDAQGVDKEPQSINRILIESVELCERRAEEQKISVDCRCEEELLVVGNSRLLQQAVLNLIDNALKYTLEGGRVGLRAYSEGPLVRIEVSDTGRGIESSHLPRLFERFYRVDPARGRKEGGTGLGLAIVKHIAQVHGGGVTVESEVGRGSLFIITLPRFEELGCAA